MSRTEIRTAADVIDEVLAGLDLRDETAALARDMADEVAMHPVASGKKPTTMAAACTYLAATLSNDRRTQGQVAAAADCHEATIGKRYPEVAWVIDQETDLVDLPLELLYDTADDDVAEHDPSVIGRKTSSLRGGGT